MIKNATVNMHHSETIIVIVRFCIRKDSILSVALESGFEGFDFKEASQKLQLEETNIETTQPKPMEVESQSRCEWLCNKKVFTTQFEATFDGLEWDGESVINKFVDWQSSGPTYSFNELRDILCGEANFHFDAAHMYLFGLAYTGRDSKNCGLPEKATWKV